MKNIFVSQSFKMFSLDKDIDKELTKVQELIKANIQRSKVIQDQVHNFHEKQFDFNLVINI